MSGLQFSNEGRTSADATPDERKLYEVAEGRYFSDPVFHARVNMAADIAMKMDAIPKVPRLQCRTYYRTSAAVALILAERNTP